MTHRRYKRAGCFRWIASFQKAAGVQKGRFAKALPSIAALRSFFPAARLLCPRCASVSLIFFLNASSWVSCSSSCLV